MRAEKLAEVIGSEFYTGVPDSQLRALCDYLYETRGNEPRRHVVAANEGNAVALAAGYHLATGKVPVVYMQNSGEGNAVNPIASLLNEQVYAIPVVFIVGWRGEPGVKDEPQHVCQGRITLELLDLLEIGYFVIGRETQDDEVERAMASFREALAKGKSVAFVIRKGALTYEGKARYANAHTMKREDAIERIALAAGDGLIVSTTGKASRELFEARERAGQGHERDFLTVGSMGHCSSIALGIALQRPEKTVWCIDGDGAALMHMGALAVIGQSAPQNLVHIVINNEAHESVGGMPTAMRTVDLSAAALACGYAQAMRVCSLSELDEALREAKAAQKTCLIDALCSLAVRENLGRPTTTAKENKLALMAYLDHENRQNEPNQKG